MPTAPNASSHVQRLALGPALRQRSDIWTEKGLTLAAMGHDKDALAAFDQALALYRRSPRAWYNKGLVLARAGRYAEALAAFDAALERNADLAFLWVQKGLVLTALGRDDQAVLALERALALDPHDALAWRYRGAALFRLKRYEEALAAYDQTLQLDSDHTVVWRARGPAEKIDVPAVAANVGIEPVWSLTVEHAPGSGETVPAVPLPDAPRPAAPPAPSRSASRSASRSSSRRSALSPQRRVPPAAQRLAPPITPSEPVAAPNQVAIERPRLAPNIALHGEMKDGGYQQTQWLAERDGRFLQLTELVYRVAECCDGAHSLEEIATQVRASTGKNVSAENVRYLLETRLLPAGIIRAPAGATDQPAASAPAPAAANRPRSLLAVNMRFAPFSPRVVNAVAGVCQHVYFPLVLVPLLLLALAGQVWLWMVVGIQPGTALDEAFSQPSILLPVLALIVVAALAHETGHASALRYGGGRARRIGMGFYMFMPVFYADVSENYRLGRWARIRTDLGGIYFNMLMDLVFFAAFFVTGQRLFLLAAAATNLEVAYNLVPFGRYDGYWVLADLTGIPDFFALMGPFLRSLPIFRWWRGPALPPLKRWVRWVYGVYTLVAVPAIALFFVSTFLALPVMLPSLVVQLLHLPTEVGQALAHHDPVSAVMSVGSALIVLLVVVAIAYSVLRLARGGVLLVWRLVRSLRARLLAPRVA